MKKILIALVPLVVIGLVVAWFLGAFSDNREEVSLDGASELAEDAGLDVGDAATEDGEDGEAETTDADEDTVDTETDAPAESEGTLTDIDGTWTVQGNGASLVGFRINEVLSTIGEFEVVGTTNEVTGTVEAAGTTISAIELVAQLDTLTTDDSFRDGALRNQAIETNEFPTASFSLTQPIELDGVPVEGEDFSVVATGDLTVHGVTRSVDFPLDARLEVSTIIVIGELNVVLSDYDIDAPSAAVVVSVEDNAIIDLSLALTR